MCLPRPGAAIRRSAAFRMTLRFALIFILGLLVTGLVVGLATQARIESLARARISQTLDTLATRYADLKPGEIGRDIKANATALSGKGLGVGYRNAGGTLSAGDIALATPAPGWSDHLAPFRDADETQWVLTTRLPDGGWLSVGASQEPYHDAIELLQSGVVWVVAVAVPLAVFSGVLLSRMVLARLDALSRTAESVRAGDLSRRAPVSGAGDEFDRLAGNLNLMLEQSEALTRNLRTVSTGIAHELRTPLARLRNRLSDLQGAGDDPEQRARLIGRSIADVDETLVTFDALLKIGEIETATQRADFQRIDLSALLSELAEIYQPVAVDGGRSIAAEIAPGVAVLGNRALLSQMIANLIENAMEHTPPGTKIAMSLQGGAAAALKVADNGPGIPADLRATLFEPFAHGAHRGHGSGLGLAIVRSICAIHGFGVSVIAPERGAAILIDFS